MKMDPERKGAGTGGIKAGTMKKAQHCFESEVKQKWQVAVDISGCFHQDIKSININAASMIGNIFNMASNLEKEIVAREHLFEEKNFQENKENQKRFVCKICGAKRATKHRIVVAEYIPQVYRGRFGRKHRFHRVTVSQIY